MYLLDTQLFADFVSADPDNPVYTRATSFVTLAEQRHLRVSISVVTIGMIRSEVSQLPAGPIRGNWERRLDAAAHSWSQSTQLYEVDWKTVESWAIVKVMDLRDAAGDVLGDDERLVVATALAHSLRLVTSTPEIYAPVAQALGLNIEAV
ncbi:MAG TPA: hypothetical protein VMS43_07565 [Allosphingosinicella sp.]|nr:hypothetical protein [Allosphingosinicella sp.]